MTTELIRPTALTIAQGIFSELRPSPHPTQNQTHTPDDLYRPLDETDLGLIQSIKGCPVPLSTMMAANTDFLIGSTYIAHPNDKEAINAGRIIAARHRFYEDFLGIGSPGNPLSKTYSRYKKEVPHIVPVDTFIASLRVYQRHGIDGVKVTSRNETAFQLSPEKIEEIVDALHQREFDVIRTVEGYPGVVNYAPETLITKLDTFKELGLDKKLVLKCPSILGLSTQTIADKKELLGSFGLDTNKILLSFPTILTLSNANITKSLRLLSRKGVDVRAVEHYPSLVGLSTDRITRRIRLLDKLIKENDMSFSAEELLSVSPTYFGVADEKVIAMMTFMKHFCSKRPKPLPDKPQTLAKYVKTPIDSLFAFIIDNGYFGSTTRNGHTLPEAPEEKEQKKKRIAAALVDPATLAMLGRPCVVAYIDYSCKTDPVERQKMLTITRKLANTKRP